MPSTPPSEMPESKPAPLAPPAPTDKASLSAFAPLRGPVFRMLWMVWLTANICMWMNDVAAAWLMTSLTTSPLWIALVQTASTLPVFLLGLPSGALADILDRRRYFIVTQFWVAGAALLLSFAVFTDAITPGLLLLLTFINGIGLAMRWPVFVAIVPELVSRPQLPSALALNGVAMNASRIVGPLLAGALIASFGIVYVFLLNAVLSVIAAFVIMRWKREHVPSPLGRERLWRAMQVGVQFVSQSTRLKAVLLRIFVFFFHSTALLALLPLVAQALPDGGAKTYTILLAAMGSGAILAAVFLPRLRQAVPRDTVVIGGASLQAAATAVVALAPNAIVAVLAMAVAGMAWISTANSLSVSAQLSLPDWVRARGMSMYQMCIMGGSALGAASWGQIASVVDLKSALLLSAATGVIAMFASYKFVVDRGIEEDLTPNRDIKAPVAAEPPTAGQIVITIEYLIDPERAEDFRALMHESRRSRLRQGAVGWDLLHDLSTPGRFIERVVDVSWIEHLRRFDRVTADDVSIRERKLAFHISEDPPIITRYVVEP